METHKQRPVTLLTRAIPLQMLENWPRLLLERHQIHKSKHRMTTLSHRLRTVSHVPEARNHQQDVLHSLVKSKDTIQNRQHVEKSNKEEGEKIRFGQRKNSENQDNSVRQSAKLLQMSSNKVLKPLCDNHDFISSLNTASWRS